MAKTKDEKTWAEKVEDACREAVRRIPGLENLPEMEYCNAIHEGMGAYLDGIEARMDELAEDSDD